MIQDLSNKQLENSYADKRAKNTDQIIIFHEGKILIRKTETISFLTYETLMDKYCSYFEKEMTFTYLFTIGSSAFFMLDAPQTLINALLAEDFHAVPMMMLRKMQPKEYVFAGATAWHLYGWYRTNRFCGACGGRMQHDLAERMVECPVCGNKVYPRINPAVIIGLRDGERIMLTRYSGRAYKRYALIAGFAEIGETLEETVAREVMEEVGVKVKNITYYRSQPWGFDSDLLMGFFCDLDGSDEIHMDANELSTAEWVHYSDVPEDTEHLSLTANMMMSFKSQF